MASQVFVMGPTARQVTIKTKPEMYMTEVLADACSKLHLDPGLYSLKHKNRELDLSNAVRHSGLSPGARLQLTLLSKSPAIINVALQLPESESQGLPGSRLTDKFPSNSTLWAVLRKFESGVTGQVSNPRNFTGRGVAIHTGKASQSGRLYYETPVLQNQGRSWQSFSDLQRTLSQLGFLRGSVLFRLTFQTTDLPLEEAILQIEEYFKVSRAPDDQISAVERNVSAESERSEVLTSSNSDGVHVREPMIAELTPSASFDTSAVVGTVHVPSEIPGLNSRPTAVFSPPTSSIPQAALINYDPADFVPTIEHAKVHQALLEKTAKNRRLLSDTELAAQEATRTEKLATIDKVDIKVRFPDQSQVIAPFTQRDTTGDLYRYIQSMLAYGDEPFGLRYISSKGSRDLPNGTQRLIADVGMVNRVLVSVSWDDNSSTEARKAPSLRPEVALRGKQLEIQTPTWANSREFENDIEKSDDKEIKDKARKKGTPKWLKLPGHR